MEKYNIDISEYDLIIGYRADDSYFRFAEDFLNNSISVEKLERAKDINKASVGSLRRQQAHDFAKCQCQNRFLRYGAQNHRTPTKEVKSEEFK